MIRKNKNSKTNVVRVTFVLPGEHPHAKSAVVGDFNNWDQSSNPLRRRSNGTYSTSVVLPLGGRFRFRYVHEGETWFNDPEADAFEPGEYGEDNGILMT